MRPILLGLASSHPEPDRPCLVACASRPGEHYGMSLPDGWRPRRRRRFCAAGVEFGCHTHRDGGPTSPTSRLLLNTASPSFTRPPRSSLSYAVSGMRFKDRNGRGLRSFEPLSLLLRILVWDGADEVVAPAVLVDLARVPLDDDLVHQHLGQCAPINSR